MDKKAATQISLNHNVRSSKERLKEDTHFLAFFLFIHFLSSDFMFMCDPWWLVQEALSVQLCLACFANSLHGLSRNCHRQAFFEAFASLEKLNLTFISVFK